MIKKNTRAQAVGAAYIRNEMAFGFSKNAIGTDISDLFTDRDERFRYQQRTKNSTKGIGKFWRFTESIFLTSADCFEVDSFRLFPVFIPKNVRATVSDDVTLGAKFKREKGGHVLNSPVLELFHLQNGSYETVLVVCKDGSVLIYELDQIRDRWLQDRKAITTLAGLLDAELVSVQLHRGHGALYWCETSKRKEEPNFTEQWSFNVFKKNIYIQGSKCGVTFGEMVSILRNCPSTNFVPLKDNILSWFSDCRNDHCPPGMCLTIAADGSTTTRVLGRVNSTGTDIRPSLSNDFMKLCVQSLNLWSNTSAPQSKVIYVDLITDSGLLVIVTENGKASITTQNLEIVTTYDLPELETTNRTFFLIEDTLCIVRGEKLVSGRLKGPTLLWNTLDVTVSSVLQNGSCRNTSAVYIRTEEEIYRWTVKDLDRISSTSESSILSSWNEAYRKRILPLDEFRQRSVLNPPLLCCESLPLTLAERCLEGNVSPTVSKAVSEQVKEICKMKTDSDLNKTIGSFVGTYFHLQEYLDSKLKN